MNTEINELLLRNAKLIADLGDNHKKLSEAISVFENEFSQSKSQVLPTKPKTAKPNIIKVDFPDNQFKKELTEKTGWVLHHSAGRDQATNMFKFWETDTQGTVATAYGIEDNGQIYEGFDAFKYWGHAIGLTVVGNNLPFNLKRHHTFDNNVRLNKQYIQVEICNWGALSEKNGKYYSWANVELPKEKVQIYDKPFRGSMFFERYTDAEIEALRTLILWHFEEHGVSKKYNEDMWDISENALQGKEGIWSHASFRTDKSDVHPQPELIQMLQSL